MSVFQNLQSASFKDVSFLVPTESKSSGKKTVDHEYPNSDRRFVEELGRQAPVYSVTAIIHGADAIQKRITLEKTLRETGRGLLVHPVYGQIQVVATEFTSRGTDSEVGKFVFDITFKDSAENITLNATATSTQLVSSIADSARVALDLSFIERYSNITTPYILQQSAAQFEGVIAQIGTLGGLLPNPSSINLSDLNSVLSTAENLANTVVRNGGNFIGQVRGIYNSYESVSGAIANYYNGYIGLISFGSNRSHIPPTTAKRITEENNLSVYEDQTRVNALISAYEAAAYVEYETDVQLNQNKAELEESYDFIISTSADDGLVFDPVVNEAINDLRVATRQVLETKQQNAWRVVDIDPGETSLTLTSYRYYGDIDNIDALANLNPSANYSVSDQDYKGLS